MSNVYAITHPHGFIKIGKSDHPVQRFNNIRGMCPYTLRLFAVISTEGNAIELEAEIHNELSEDHHHGEWFKSSESKVFNLFESHAESDNRIYSVEEVNFERDNKLRESETPDTGFTRASET